MAWHFQRTKVQSSLCRRTFNAPAALAAALALTLTTQRRFSTAPRPHQPATLATATPTGALEGHQRRTSPTRAGATGPYTRSCVALLTRSKVPRTRKHDRGRNALLRHLALRVKSVLLRRGELSDARARPIYTRSCARRLPRRRRRRCLRRCPRSRRSTRPPFIAPPDATTSATSTRHARGTVCDDARPSTRTPAPTGSHMATPTRTRPRRRPSPPQHTRTHTHSPTRRRRSRARVHRCPL